MASDDFEGGLDDGSSTPADGNSDGGGFFSWLSGVWTAWGQSGYDAAAPAGAVIGDALGSAGSAASSAVTDVVQTVEDALPSQTSFVLYLIAAIIILFLIAYITREVAG